MRWLVALMTNFIIVLGTKVDRECRQLIPPPLDGGIELTQHDGKISLTTPENVSVFSYTEQKYEIVDSKDLLVTVWKNFRDASKCCKMKQRSDHTVECPMEFVESDKIVVQLVKSDGDSHLYTFLNGNKALPKAPLPPIPQGFAMCNKTKQDCCWEFTEDFNSIDISNREGNCFKDFASLEEIQEKSVYCQFQYERNKLGLEFDKLENGIHTFSKEEGCHEKNILSSNKDHCRFEWLKDNSVKDYLHVNSSIKCDNETKVMIWDQKPKDGHVWCMSFILYGKYFETFSCKIKEEVEPVKKLHGHLTVILVVVICVLVLTASLAVFFKMRRSLCQDFKTEPDFPKGMMNDLKTYEIKTKRFDDEEIVNVFSNNNNEENFMEKLKSLDKDLVVGNHYTRNTVTGSLQHMHVEPLDVELNAERLNIESSNGKYKLRHDSGIGVTSPLLSASYPLLCVQKFVFPDVEREQLKENDRKILSVTANSKVNTINGYIQLPGRFKNNLATDSDPMMVTDSLHSMQNVERPNTRTHESLDDSLYHVQFKRNKEIPGYLVKSDATFNDEGYSSKPSYADDNYVDQIYDTKNVDFSKLSFGAYVKKKFDS